MNFNKNTLIVSLIVLLAYAPNAMALPTQEQTPINTEQHSYEKAALYTTSTALISYLTYFSISSTVKYLRSQVSLKSHIRKLSSLEWNGNTKHLINYMAISSILAYVTYRSGKAALENFKGAQQAKNSQITPLN